jgi:GDP-4-dehydro-6-deoxy-D-mannose reductase
VIQVAGPALVTGGSGFAGSHLIEHLLTTGEPVAAWCNPHGRTHPSLEGPVTWTAVDLLDRERVAVAVAELRPSVIYHCAGAADVGQSWTNPDTPLRVNALGTHHLLDAVRLARLTCKVLVTGSALVYRTSLEPLHEDSPIGPASPYAFSKLAQEMIAAHAASVPAVVARSFNHAGPRQSPAYAASSFARQIADIESGLREPVIQVGNLEARRDISDVRDTVRAYHALMTSANPSAVYNVCRGRAYRIGDLLDVLLAMARVRITAQPDAQRMRPSDNPLLLGDHSRLTRDTGWTPDIPIEKTLADLLDFWRRQAASA